MKQKIIIAAAITILNCTAHAKEGCVLNPDISTSTSLRIVGCHNVILKTYDTPQGNTYRFLSCQGECDSDMDKILNPKQEDICITKPTSNTATACGRPTQQWSAITDIYGRKTYEVCDELDYCYTAWQYSCNQGYYGMATFTAQNQSDYSRCTRCPVLDGTTSTTPVYGVVPTKTNGDGYDNYSIAKCYIPKDTAANDDTGTFLYTENCFYSPTA